MESNVTKKSNTLVIGLVGFAAIFVILLGIRSVASVINPILLAVVLTITVLPIPGKLTKKGLSPTLSLVLTILMVVLILLLVIFTVFFSAQRLATTAPVYLAEAEASVNAALPPETTTTAGQTVTELTVKYRPAVSAVVSVVFDILVQFGLALVIFFFMIAAAVSLPSASKLGFDPRSSMIGRISSLTSDVRRYMSMLTGINLLVGAGDVVFLWIMGVPYALLWGLLAWFMGYIPSIGFMIALIPPVILAYAMYGTGTALIVLVGYIVINGGIQNFLQPKMMGQGLKINPVVVFVSLFIWGYLLGGIGAILAVPLTLLVLVILQNFESTRALTVLLRYVGDEKKAERKAAMKQVKHIIGKAKKDYLPSESSKTAETSKTTTKPKKK